MASLNVTVVSSQYSGRLQSKWLHYQKPTFRNERYARKRICHWCVGEIETYVPRDHSLTSFGKPSDARQKPSGRIFLSILHTHDRVLLSIIPGLGHWQTVYTQIRHRRMRHLIRLYTLCLSYRKLREERAKFSAFRTFVRFVLVWICRFPLPLWVWEGLRFVIVALPGLFSYLFFLNKTVLSPPPGPFSQTSLRDAGLGG